MGLERCHIKMKLKKKIVAEINVLKNVVLKVKKNDSEKKLIETVGVFFQFQSVFREGRGSVSIC